jgi:hypothetical protein
MDLVVFEIDGNGMRDVMERVELSRGRDKDLAKSATSPKGGACSSPGRSVLRVRPYTGTGLPEVYPKRVPRVRVRCPDSDTVHIPHPLPAVHGYARVRNQVSTSQPC